MEAKTWMVTLGIGAVAGTFMGMMLPKNREMQQLGKHAAHTAAQKVTQAVDNIEKKMY